MRLFMMLLCFCCCQRMMATSSVLAMFVTHLFRNHPDQHQNLVQKETEVR